MIKGAHAMFFSSEPEALREFFRDKLGFTAHDIGHGWLIFDLPEADLGVHPTSKELVESPSGTPAIMFYCDDLKQTMTELGDKGVQFVGDVEEQPWGQIASFKAPGDFEIKLFQPNYAKS